MIPVLGDKYEIDIQVTSKPKAEYTTDKYFVMDLPVGLAVMVGYEIVTEGQDVAQHDVETIICLHLRLPEPEPPQKGGLNRLFGKP